jgi:hypothetical protein
MAAMVSAQLALLLIIYVNMLYLPDKQGILRTVNQTFEQQVLHSESLI